MISLKDAEFKRNIILPEEFLGKTISLKKFAQPSGYKVNLQLLDDHELIAYLAFKVGDNHTRSDFSGMHVKEAFRKKGISKKLFEVYQKITTENQLDTALTTVQKKPFVCKILKNLGYEAKGKSQDQKVEIIENKLFFNNERVRNKYLNSNYLKQPEFDALLISEKEKILNVINPDDICTVYLNTKYKKV